MAPPLLAIVDYDEAFREMLDAVFTEEGYRTLLLVQGSGAHAAIRQAQPDLVLLDLWLERRDAGWELVEQLCDDPATRDIPIIVCSADSQTLKTQALRMQELGCSVVAKPFDLDELLAAARQAMRRREARHPEKQRPAERPASA